MDISINYVAVVIAAVASTVIGTAWYSMLFGKMWMHAMGITKERMEGMKKHGMGKLYGINFVATLVMAYVLAHFVAVWNTVDMSGAIQLAFWTWLGFIATVMVGSILWENKPVKLYYINVSFQLVSLSAMAIILTLWK